MAEQKKTELTNAQTNQDKELDLDQLKDVAGGSIRNVIFTPTTDISDDTKSKI